ncbi:glutathione S-transferase [Roseiarcus fermentans]|uniref:Glutathione S-transferase n=1 Tax=Roseiarcus fermentans TaxID=1473586 RepID=A0A366F4G1_9HYPH|nr:glutathione S-transferase family protein [Roseiarcus fermentans]RBP08595.1 glutathione S-transferase [Roseiarcus fermentans]
MLRIWGRRNSSNVQSVMWTVAELGLPYERYDFGHRFGGVDTPEFTAMNPNRTVPVLRDGDGEPLWESAAINRYLASRYGAAPFWPQDLAARAQVDKWAEWAKVNVTGNFSAPVFAAIVRTPPSRRDPQAIARAIAELDGYLDIAERRLTALPYLAGDDFTLADVAFGYLLYRYFDIDIPRPPRRSLADYYAKLTARPAYREHVMVSYDELRAAQ